MTKRNVKLEQRKPMTAGEAVLIFGYVLIALTRQVAHDLRTIARWLKL